MELDLFQVKDIDRTQGKIKSLKGETLTLDDIKEKNTNIRKSTDAFESLMVSMMLKEMRKAIPKSGFLSGGQGEEMFQDMLDNEYARRISERGGLGISDAMYRQMKIELPTVDGNLIEVDA